MTNELKMFILYVCQVDAGPPECVHCTEDTNVVFVPWNDGLSCTQYMPYIHSHSNWRVGYIQAASRSGAFSGGFA